MESARFHLNAPCGAWPYPDASALDWAKAAPAEKRGQYRTHLIMDAHGIGALDVLGVFKEMSDLQDQLTRMRR